MSTYDDIKSHQFQYHIHIPHHPTLSNPWPCELCPARRLGPTTPRSRTKDPERSRTPAMPAASSTLRTQLEAFQTCPNSKRSWWSWSALVHCFFAEKWTSLDWFEGKSTGSHGFPMGFPMNFLGGSCTFSLEPIQVIQREAFQTLGVDSWSAVLSFLAENAPQFLAFDLDILDVKHSCLPSGYD